MEGYKIQFNIYANSQEEADAVSRIFAQFVNDNAKEGRAVTAQKLLSVVSKWGTNPIVKNYFR